MKRSLVLPQLDMPCFIDTHGKSATFSTETEKEWIGWVVEGRWWRKKRRGEGETAVGM